MYCHSDERLQNVEKSLLSSILRDASIEHETLNYQHSQTESRATASQLSDFAGGASGAGGPLGNYTKHVRRFSPPQTDINVNEIRGLGAEKNSEKSSEVLAKYRASRRRLYEMQKQASWLLQDYSEKGPDRQRVTHCRFSVISKDKPVEVMNEAGRSWFQGLQVCGSVWSCPVCSNNISEQRRTEANKLLSWSRDQNYHVYMVTMTFSHKLGDDLRSLKESATAAWRRLQRRRDFAKLKPDIIGTVRALEVTHGVNGWHPHFHLIVITRKRLKTKLEALNGAWLKSLETEGLEASASHGWQVQNADAAGNYIAKFGAAEELTLGSKKRGRGSRTAFQLLEDYTYEQDTNAGALFTEFAKVMKGSQQLMWSQGLKALAGIDEMTDDEAADEGEGEQLRGLIEYETWIGDYFSNRIGARRRRIKILEAADRGSDSCFHAIYINEEDEPPPCVQLIEDVGG